MNADSLENWLLAMLVRGGAIGVMWYVIGMAIGKASADRLSTWWRCGVLALLVVVFFPWSAVRWSIPVSRPAPVMAIDATVDPVPISAVDVPAASNLSIKSASPTLSWWAWVWAFGSTALLARLLASHWRVRRIVRGAEPVLLPRIKDLLAEECIRAGVRRPVIVKSHADVQVPFVAGWFRPVIVFPTDTSRLGEAELRLMLRHEVAHVLRFDVAWQLFAELTAVLHWPNPFVWLLRGRLRLAHEANADDFVLAGGADGSTYATLLFGLARSKDHSADEPCLASMARVSTLRARIGLILDAKRRRNALQPVMRWTLMAGSCLAAMIFGFTGLRAQVVAPASPTTPTDQSWSRTYRDTFHLEKSFSE